MLKIIGYADKVSVAPGERISFMVSTNGDLSYETRLIRVIHGDVNPKGPGQKFQHIPTAIDGVHQGHQQITDSGSYMYAERLPQVEFGAGISFGVMIWPTLLERSQQTILVLCDAVGKPRIHLLLRDAGAISLVVTGREGQAVSLDLPNRVLLRRWYSIVFSVLPSGDANLALAPLDASPLDTTSAPVTARLIQIPMQQLASVYVAGSPIHSGSVALHYNGKIDAPVLFRGIADDSLMHSYRTRTLTRQDRRRLLVAWDFSKDIGSTIARDIGPYGCDGALVNLPARAMKGWNWNGEHHDWRTRPEQYGAIHFHEDDLYDANWKVSHTFLVPDNLTSGAYALHLRCGENTREALEEDYVPFFVRSPRSSNPRKVGPKLVFLAPTCSYMAYANESQGHTIRDSRGRLVQDLELEIGRLVVLDHADLYLREHPELGLSLYDRHVDGSGVCYSSRLRPILNFRPYKQSWVAGHGSALWQFSADTQLLDWLEHKGFEFDVITDEDLHYDGLNCLQDYSVLITGTHPEYWSTRMWDSFRAWMDRGGSLMYVGGNGWYWRIALHETLPGVIEIRRAEDGTRSWEAEPGEYHHSFNGELSGLWRRSGRPPNVVCGVGFIAQGFDISSYYRRADDSASPDAAFIFRGVSDDIIGDFGLIGGGAAGLEVDCINYDLGTPLNALRIATSEEHTPMMVIGNEEFSIMGPNVSADLNERARADMVFYETQAGGAVFSTGSIAWCGSLSHSSYENNVSRITENVLRRFLDGRSYA